MPRFTGKLDPSLNFHMRIPVLPGLPEIQAKKIGPINVKAIPFIADRGNYNTLEGFKKRIGPKTPDVHKSMCEEIKYTVRKLLHKLTPLPRMEWDDQYIENFLRHYDKPLKQKQKLREAYYRILADGIKKSDYHVKCFVKREFYEDEKYARIIMTRQNGIKALMSWAIHQCDEELFHNSELSRYFIKGMTPQQQVDAMAKRFNGHSLFLETDYSSFESSFSLKYQKMVEMKFMRYMLRNNPHILRVVLRCYETHVIKHKAFTATISGGRMSGDLWTSSMNGFSNLVNIMTLARVHNIEWDGFCEGDDGLFWLSSPSLTPEHYAQLGFVIKMNYQTRIQDCSFCGKIFDDKSKHVLATPEQLNRVGWSHNKRYWNARPKVKHQLIEARALAIAYSYPGCPCLQAWAKSILTNRKTDKLRTVFLKEKYQLKELLNHHTELDAQKMFDSLEFPEPTSQDRQLFSDRFGISPLLQRKFEQHVTQHPWADFALENTDIHTGGRSNWSAVFHFSDKAKHVW